MAKPRFIITLPLDPETTQWIGKDIDEKLNDYHVITICNPGLKEFKFEVFYEKDFNEIKYEELKQMVQDTVKL